MKNLYVILILLLMKPVFTQDDLTREIEENRRKLEQVRQEIRTLEKSIAASRNKETSILDQVKRIDREMSIVNKAKQLLQKEINLLTRKVANTRQALKTTEIRLKKFKSDAAARMVHNYKYGKVRNLELIIKSNSFNQALEQQLANDLANQQAAFSAKEREERKYIAAKAQKESAIRKIQWDRATKKKLLSDRTESQAALTRIIANLLREQERKGGQTVIRISGDPFDKRKGKLRWPVRGKVIHAYGKQKDKILKTTVNNTGIDIQADLGAEVRAVCDGRVSLVTYLTGYGNTIIIDHGDGYYTVYAHLDEIMVEDTDLINEGQFIGRVGESGSLEGAKLHFEIYANDLTVNPQTWLQ
jgi:septal ring factor EnvC (AmiA/AmiB activator)